MIKIPVSRGAESLKKFRKKINLLNFKARWRGEVYDFMVNLVSKVTKKFDASLSPFFVSVPIAAWALSVQATCGTKKKVFRLEKWTLGHTEKFH